MNLASDKKEKSIKQNMLKEKKSKSTKWSGDGRSRESYRESEEKKEKERSKQWNQLSL